MNNTDFLYHFSTSNNPTPTQSQLYDIGVFKVQIVVLILVFVYCRVRSVITINWQDPSLTSSYYDFEKDDVMNLMEILRLPLTNKAEHYVRTSFVHHGATHSLFDYCLKIHSTLL